MDQIDRRHLLKSGGAGLAALAGSVPALATASPAAAAEADARAFGLVPDSKTMQTAALQKAIDVTARRATPLRLPPGQFWTGALTLPGNTQIIGTGAATVISVNGLGAITTAPGKHGHLTLADLTLDGVASRTSAGDRSAALLIIDNIDKLALRRITLRNAPANGARISRCAGEIESVSVKSCGEAGLFLSGSRGVIVRACVISDCANNGILVWQPADGHDGTQLIGNRISRIRSAAGGSGQNGNGINVFRAAGVLVAQNTMTDCAYSAVRGNAASNIQIIANQARRIGEVAIYSEFGFQGAVIAQNIVDTAATGISVTNFNVGGRLAVVQGNLVRNLKRREHEPVDKRGNGIAVEADATVTGNTVEGAPTAGLVIGWGQHMRNVVAVANTIRDAGVGVKVTGNPAAVRALIANNVIAQARNGAIRRMTRGIVYGPDLVTRPSDPRIVVRGNVVTGA